MDIAPLIVKLGGIASTRTLRESGAPERALTEAVRDAAVSRICRGWYTVLPAAHPKVLAVAAGGLLTGSSALWELGAWMLHRPRAIHVAIPAHATTPTHSRSVVLHWERQHEIPSRPGVVGLSEALIRVALDEDVEVAAPALDWALATGRLDRLGYESLLRALPASARCIRDWVDEKSQSVLESVARVRLMKHGWSCVSQVPVGELGAIDLVIEDHVALELDGRRFHESTFEGDRRKDLAITREGRHPLRVSTSMLTESWADILLAIQQALAARGLGSAGIPGESPPVPRGHQHSSHHPPLITGYPGEAGPG